VGVAWGGDPRLVVGGAIVLAGLIFAVMAFAIAWLRADPTERKRWRHRGRHGGGGSLGPTYARW